MCKKISKILEIKDRGSEVCLYSCDVADFKELSTTLDDIENRLGPVCGVIHTAGIPGEGFIHSKKREEFKKVISPKIHGTVNLVNLFVDKAPDWYQLPVKATTPLQIALWMPVLRCSAKRG